MSRQLADETLELAAVDRAASHDLYAYDALMRDEHSTPIPPAPDTFEHLLDVDFVD